MIVIREEQRGGPLDIEQIVEPHLEIAIIADLGGNILSYECKMVPGTILRRLLDGSPKDGDRVTIEVVEQGPPEPR